MHEGSPWHFVKCSNCKDAMVLTKKENVENIVCTKCAKLRRARSPKSSMPAEQRHRRSRSKPNYIDPDSFIVEYDPTPIIDGGFRKGTIITQIQAECMCSVGSFDEGTILTDQKKRLFQVCTDYRGKQRLRRIRP